MGLAGPRGGDHAVSQRHGPVCRGPASRHRHRGRHGHAGGRRGCRRGPLCGHGRLVGADGQRPYGGRPLRHLLPSPVVDVRPPGRPCGGRPEPRRRGSHRHPFLDRASPALRRARRRKSPRLPRPVGLPAAPHDDPATPRRARTGTGASPGWPCAGACAGERTSDQTGASPTTAPAPGAGRGAAPSAGGSAAPSAGRGASSGAGGSAAEGAVRAAAPSALGGASSRAPGRAAQCAAGRAGPCAAGRAGPCAAGRAGPCAAGRARPRAVASAGRSASPRACSRGAPRPYRRAGRRVRRCATLRIAGDAGARSGRPGPRPPRCLPRRAGRRRPPRPDRRTPGGHPANRAPSRAPTPPDAWAAVAPNARPVDPDVGSRCARWSGYVPI